MLTTQSLVLAAIAAVVGGTIAVTWAVLRARRGSVRAKRREHLKGVGRREGFDFIGPNLPSDLLEVASRFRRDDHGVRLEDVMIASDREGRSWFARRKVDGADHQVLGFEIRGELNVRGLHIEPLVAGGASPEGWRRFLPRRRADEKPRLQVRTVWETDARRVTDELTRRAVDRWIQEVARSCTADGKMPIGIEIHADHAWVHSLVPLDGVALGVFVKRAREIRRMVLDEVLRRPATMSTPVVRRTDQQVEEGRHAKSDTRPVFAVPESEGADATGEAETIQLSAVDLLREAPDPRRKSLRRKAVNDFEIPEPEERVTLIRSN